MAYVHRPYLVKPLMTTRLGEKKSIKVPFTAFLGLVHHVSSLLGIVWLPVRAHENRLQQVFFNLVTNARDAIVDRALTEDRKSTRLNSSH